jgi:hypothetical protein
MNMIILLEPISRPADYDRRVTVPAGIATDVRPAIAAARKRDSFGARSAAGIDARPVLHGGIPDWPGHTVEFRRCGSG